MKLAIFDPMILSWKVFEGKECVQVLSLFEVKQLIEKEVNKSTIEPKTDMNYLNNPRY